MPIEIEVHVVPHFKATINAKVKPERLGQMAFLFPTKLSQNRPFASWNGVCPFWYAHHCKKPARTLLGLVIIYVRFKALQFILSSLWATLNVNFTKVTLIPVQNEEESFNEVSKTKERPRVQILKKSGQPAESQEVGHLASVAYFDFRE